LNTQPIRIALIGCGGNMRGHVRRLTAMPEVTIVALCDPMDASIERTVETYPQLKELPTFKDHKEMLKSIKPDAVEISTPHTFHYANIMDSLNAGCHVLVEKPMVCTVKEAKDVVRAQETTGKVVLISYQRHTQPLFRWMKEFLSAGKLGEIQFVHCLQHQNWYRRRAETGQGWRHLKELSGGGQLNDSGSHIVDIMLYITDLTPEEVHCTQQNFVFDVDVNSAINVKFKGGAIGSMQIVGNAPGIGGSVWEDITIFGSDGALYYRQLAQPDYKAVLEYRRFDSEKPIPISDFPPGSTPDQNFVNAILGKEPAYSPPIWGLRTIQLSEAAWQSAEMGEAVRVE
jgi:predicted dehydrogenase